MITQGDINKSHNHTINDGGHSHGLKLGYDYYSNIGVYTCGANTIVGTGMTLPHSGNNGTSGATTNISLESSGGIESRPINTSIKIWKRTA